MMGDKERMGILGKAGPQHWFYCSDSSVLCSVSELEKKLHAINEQAYWHHVRQENNDFSNWIRDVFSDHELASEIRTARSPAEAAAIVKKHLLLAAQSRKEIENAMETAMSAKAAKIGVAKKATAKPKTRKAPIAKKARARRTAKPKIAKRIIIGRNIKITRKTKRKATKKKAAAKKRNRPKIAHNKRVVHKIIHKRGSSSRKKRRSTSSKKAFKKQVKGWLNWLKIVPEL